MSDDYLSLGKLTYGSTQLSLATYTAKTSPVIVNLVRTGTAIDIEAEGEISGATAAEFAANLAAAAANLSIDGQDLTITGINGAVEFQILASECLYGGPNVSFDLKDGHTPLQKVIVIHISAGKPPTGGTAGATTNTYKSNTDLRPDNLLVVTWTGQASGPNAVSYFLGDVVTATFRNLYPLPKWAVDVKYDLVDDKSFIRPAGSSPVAGSEQINYTITATQMYGDLPIASLGSFAVDGNISFRKERDEKMRLTETLEVNLLLEGDPFQMATFLRPSGEGVIVLRESMQIETLRENRLQASFTVLRSGDTSQLMDFQESIEFNIPGEEWEMQQYEAASPVLVRRQQSIGTATQSGTSIAAGSYLVPPPPLFPLQSSAPRTTYTYLNEVERQTTWSYSFFLFDAQSGPLTADDAAGVDLSKIARKYVSQLGAYRYG